jgi:hypothetical protein
VELGQSLLGIWLQMIIITFFGVMFSTFLTGPVAMFATAIVYVVGLFREFILKLVTGELEGGGPLESLLRIVFQKNVMIELDMGMVIDRAVPAFDRVLLFFLWIAARSFRTSPISTLPGSSPTDSTSAATCWPSIF